MKNNVINFKIKLFFGVIALCLALNSCSFFKSEPLLVTDENNNLGVPVIKNIKESDKINSGLNDFFSQIAGCLKIANQSGTESSLVYSLYLKERGEKNDAYALESKIYVEDKYYFALPDVALYTDGMCVLPPMPDKSALSDGSYIYSLAKLNSYGIGVDLNCYSNRVNAEQCSKIIISAWEHLSGQPIDCSQVVTTGGENDADYKKALVLGLEPIIWQYDCYINPDNYIDDYFVNDAFLKLTQKANEELYGKYSDSVSFWELSDITESFLKNYLFSVSSDKNREMTERWNEMCFSLDYSFIDADIFNNTDKLSRIDIAKYFVGLYEQAFGEIETEYYGGFIDCDNTAAKKAAEKFILEPMFGFEFNADYIADYKQIYRYTAEFANTLYNRFAEERFSGYLTGEGFPNNLGIYDGLIKRTCAFLDSFEHKEKFTGERTVINNTRDYNWYYTQNDGSDYASVNCMPSITCMALKWCDKNINVTPSDLRGLYPENTGGWYLYTVEQCLDKYGVRYEEKAVSLNSILSDLDRGKIILTQNSEKSPGETGHCMVIYGYEKFNNSTVFYVQDSDVAEGKNIYGKYYGEDMRIEARYAMETITRFTDRYIAVSESL